MCFYAVKGVGVKDSSESFDASTKFKMFATKEEAEKYLRDIDKLKMNTMYTHCYLRENVLHCPIFIVDSENNCFRKEVHKNFSTKCIIEGELLAILQGIERCIFHLLKDVTIFCNCPMVYKIIEGKINVSENMLKIVQEIQEKRKLIKVEFSWIYSFTANDLYVRCTRNM